MRVGNSKTTYCLGIGAAGLVVVFSCGLLCYQMGRHQRCRPGFQSAAAAGGAAGVAFEAGAVADQSEVLALAAALALIAAQARFGTLVGL